MSEQRRDGKEDRWRNTFAITVVLIIRDPERSLVVSLVQLRQPILFTTVPKTKRRR